MQTITFRMDKQWSPSVQHRQLYPITCDRTWWKIISEKRKYIRVCVWDWVTFLYSRNWQNIINQLYFNKKIFLNTHQSVNSNFPGESEVSSLLPFICIFWFPWMEKGSLYCTICWLYDRPSKVILRLILTLIAELLKKRTCREFVCLSFLGLHP